MPEPSFVRKLVEIDEKWAKVDGIVYRLWRFVPDTEWTVQHTPYKDIPVFFFKLQNPHEW